MVEMASPRSTGRIVAGSRKAGVELLKILKLRLKEIPTSQSNVSGTPVDSKVLAEGCRCLRHSQLRRRSFRNFDLNCGYIVSASSRASPHIRGPCT